MKKKFLSFALTISVLSSLFAALPMVASATESTDENTGGDVTVGTNPLYCYYAEDTMTAKVKIDPASDSGVVFLGIYDNDKFVTAKQVEFSAGETEKTIEITGIDENYLYYNAVAFYWNGFNSLKPLETHKGETEMVTKLKAVAFELSLYTERTKPGWSAFTTREKNILKPIRECIEEAISIHADKLDAEFIKTTYEAEIDDVKTKYEKLEADGKAEEFKGKMPKYFTTDNLYWIAETLGIDTSEFQK